MPFIARRWFPKLDRGNAIAIVVAIAYVAVCVATRSLPPHWELMLR